VVAYCFMPDHLHLLAFGTADQSCLPVFAQRAKQLSGFYGQRACGRRVWQSGYFERVLRESEDTRTVTRYILANPVRAGLVANPAVYPFSGSARYTLTELLEYIMECPS